MILKQDENMVESLTVSWDAAPFTHYYKTQPAIMIVINQVVCYLCHLSSSRSIFSSRTLIREKKSSSQVNRVVSDIRIGNTHDIATNLMFFA